jgi:hypothetical protein
VPGNHRDHWRVWLSIPLACPSPLLLLPLSMKSGTSWKTSTNETGRYDFPRLPVGVYRVDVEKPGFQRAERTDVQVVLNQTAHLDFSLAVGNLTELVQVSSEIPIVLHPRSKE